MLQSFISHHWKFPRVQLQALRVPTFTNRCSIRPNALPCHSLRTERWNATLAEGVLPVNDGEIQQQSGQEKDQAKPDNEQSSLKTLKKVSEARFNQIKVQQLSKHVFEQVFPEGPDQAVPEDLVKLSTQHLTEHNLYGKNSDTSKPIAFDLPPLVGKDLAEHFYLLGMNAAEPYISRALEFSEIENLAERPSKWLEVSGWMRYAPGEPPRPVLYPEEDELVFDVEVMYKVSPFAVMACAASEKAWYAWISPWLLGESPFIWQLIPVGPPDVKRIIVGHNIGYDRARVKEEYSIKPTKNFYLDTMSLHVAVNGMCSRQRPTWMKHRKNMETRAKMAAEMESQNLREILLQAPLTEEEEEELWIARSSINSLKDVAKFHCGLDLNKEARDFFATTDKSELVTHLQDLLTYCATDVEATFEVFKKVLPGFLQVCPHPVSFAALRHLSSVILPINRSWEEYIRTAEDKYMELSGDVERTLVNLAKGAVHRFFADPANVVENFQRDPISHPGSTRGEQVSPLTLKDISANPWLSQLDWSVEPVRMLKPKKAGDIPRPVSNQKMPGYPFWYRDLRKKCNEDIKVTVRSRLAPFLLQLMWEDYPLFWSQEYGWTFRVPKEEMEKYNNKPVIRCEFNPEIEEDSRLREDQNHVYLKLPHKDGAATRCTNPLSKNYLKFFEDGILTSEYEQAKVALEMNAACSYWISARERIISQMVVYESQVEGGFGFSHLESASDEGTKPEEQEATGERDTMTPESQEGLFEEVLIPELIEFLSSLNEPADVIANVLSVLEKPVKELIQQASRKGPRELGFIVPQVIPMGTITRRAVERTWLTASNAKKNRVGSELKAMAKAPPGYCFVGADVDSQELWIASLVGDAQFRLHGGNAIGFMTLEGTKAAGTDLHSKTANILKISRNNAKIFNYGRIYGAGVKFAATLLRQFNPGISDEEAQKTAEELYQETKGHKIKNRVIKQDRSFWYGGTESFVFNRLEEFADQNRPRTPVLGAGLTEALMREYLSKNSFMTSRINWAIQSSGVDYLHLLIISMDYLIRRYSLNVRLAITVHDEIRYLVKEEDKFRAAMALQVANVWTRAMFAKQMGINDLPQSCAYFSAVDIDKVLRKEVYLDCITPSHVNAIPHGISLDINELLDKGDDARLDENIPNTISFENIPPFTPRPSVMEELRKNTDIYFLRAQMARTDDEVVSISKEKIAAQKRIRGPYVFEKPEKVIKKSEEEAAESWHESLNGEGSKNGKKKKFGPVRPSEYATTTSKQHPAFYLLFTSFDKSGFDKNKPDLGESSPKIPNTTRKAAAKRAVE